MDLLNSLVILIMIYILEMADNFLTRHHYDEYNFGTIKLNWTIEVKEKVLVNHILTFEAESRSSNMIFSVKAAMHIYRSCPSYPI